MPPIRLRATPLRLFCLLVVLSAALSLFFFHDGLGWGDFVRTSISGESDLDDIANSSAAPESSSSTATSSATPPTPSPPPAPARDPLTGRANATLLMLARNSDTDGAAASVRSLEASFNAARGYPWLFLNDEPFSAAFRARVAALTNASVAFGLVPREHWVQPAWIDEERAAAARMSMALHGVIYGESVSYRNMCRFNSGFFFRHELLQNYKWYWRVEPDVSFTCQLDFDPFVYMIEHNKRYSFTISLKEIARTVPSLWETVKDFTVKYPEHISEDNGLDFISRDGGKTYNRCHFWSNFEIADLDFFRAPAYRAFFAHLDAAGGFYYERWGDAPVHSIAAALLLRRGELHFFDDIGYRHAPFEHCPQGVAHARGQCACKWFDNYDYTGYATFLRLLRLVCIPCVHL